MSTSSPSRHAIALYDFLVQEWEALGVKPTTWCRENGIADPTVLRWRDGTEPDMRSLRRVAEALDRSLLDVLLAAGYLTDAEAQGMTISPRPVADVRDAIRLDPNLGASARELMNEVYDKIMQIQNQKAPAVVRASSRRRSTRTG